MDIKELKEIIKLMKDNKLTELEVEQDGTKIKLKRGNNVKINKSQELPVMQQYQVAPPSIAQTPPVLEKPKEDIDDPNVVIVKSPMVGTFYSSPAPNASAFVSVGQDIKLDDTICIVEAMKIMNEIKTEVAGKVIEILVENGQAVEFDQPIMKIKKA